VTIVVGETPIEGTSIDNGLPIGIKEAKEVMKIKSVLKDIFRETFMQLIINHDFNPAFPALDYRTPCSCPGSGPGGTTITDCGCPAQTASAATGTYPQTVTLTYCTTSCNDCTLAPSGKVVSGNVDVTFSAPFTDPGGHTITIVPQSNFMIDGYAVSATDITLMGPPGATSTNPTTGLEENFYLFQSINGLSVTDPAGATTQVCNTGFLSGGSYLSIADVGSNHGSINNAFGLLDDIFTISIVESEAICVICSNGETIKQYTEDPIEYDMSCSCIQSGTVVMIDDVPNANGENVPLMTYYYDYNGAIDITTGEPITCPVACPGECDDFILLETHCATFHDPNAATTRSGCGFESIDCL